MRIRGVAFLNSAPLWWGLRAGMRPAGWKVDFDTPSACARKLPRAGRTRGSSPSVEIRAQPRSGSWRRPVRGGASRGDQRPAPSAAGI